MRYKKRWRSAYCAPPSLWLGIGTKELSPRLLDTITKVSKDSPVVIVTGFSDITSGDVTYYTANIKRESSFTSTRATFTVTFNIYYTAGPYDTYVDCGRFKITIVGDVNGGEAISWSPYYSSGRYVYAQ